ncbi:MAG TPA: NAD(P)-dependent oxidoreductase [Verrucomicrobiae bacterium]|nr:NAD(P)-dependent oxidoreductase [Verrucomicrobiae bacterium]
MNVQFYEAFEEEVVALRQHLPAHLPARFTFKTIQEAGDTEPPAEIISIRTQSVIPPSWAGKVRGVVARTTGYDHLIGQKIPCGYLPLYCTRAVAEQAMLLAMALLRKLPAQIAQFPAFDRDGLTGGECAGKKLLVVGVGNIGGEVVKLGQALGMQVRGVDIVEKHASVSYMKPDEGLAWADIIVCSMNLTKENACYFCYETLKRAKKGVLFVNVARGEFTPTEDMALLLDEGHLGGLALDVYENESSLGVALRAGKAEFPLLGRPNVILTPHNAFNTAEAVDRKAKQTVEQIEHFLAHKWFLWPVP